MRVLLTVARIVGPGKLGLSTTAASPPPSGISYAMARAPQFRRLRHGQQAETPSALCQGQMPSAEETFLRPASQAMAPIGDVPLQLAA